MVSSANDTGLDPGLPLGVFDSGLGGLTVVRALLEALPAERILYLGDTARVPYGTRSAETVIRYARGSARVLTRRGIKALIVACNTVSAVALDMLRAELDVPVVGVIDPGAAAGVEAAERLAASQGPLPRIGVLGTAGTVASGAYPRAVGRLSTRHEVVAEPAPLLVPLAEEGWLEGDVPELAVRRYLEPLLEAGAGVVVLGCTHYPLLYDTIVRVAEQIAGRAVPVVDSAHATAQAVAALLAEGRIPPAPDGVSGARLELYVTDLPQSFQTMSSRFLGHEALAVHQVDIEPG